MWRIRTGITTFAAKFRAAALWALPRRWRRNITSPTGPAATGNWDDGWDAYKRRDHATATDIFMVLAERGDGRARITAMIMMILEEGGPWHDFEPMLDLWDENKGSRSFKEAEDWFRAAADGGDTKAVTLLAWIRMEGYAGQRDDDEAMKLCRKAAELGEVTAQKLLAIDLAWKDEVGESANWFQKAAVQGDPLGQRMFALVFEEDDKVQAYMWYTLAVAQGSEEAAEERNELAGEMTILQIANAQELARAWTPKTV